MTLRDCTAAAAATWGARVVRMATALAPVGPVITLDGTGRAERVQTIGLETEVRPVHTCQQDPPSTLVIMPGPDRERLVVSVQVHQNQVL
eukprot:10208565-Prorocentrum_lima.AAC.1